MPDFTDIVTVLDRLRRLGRPKESLAVQRGSVVSGQKVHVDGGEEVCVVLRVDRQRHVADLLRLGKVHKVEAGIPLALLTPAVDSRDIDGDVKIPA